MMSVHETAIMTLLQRAQRLLDEIEDGLLHEETSDALQEAVEACCEQLGCEDVYE